MLVREAMTSDPVRIGPDTSISQALRTLDDHRVTSLPVVDESGLVVGIVSEADLIRGILLSDQRRHFLPTDPTDRRLPCWVHEVMTSEVRTVAPDDDLAHVVDVMTSTAIKSMPVTREGRLVGVISRRDVVHAIIRDDDEVAAEIRDLLAAVGQDWRVTVDGGVATVTGCHDEHEVKVATALAASVRGVIQVVVEPC